MPLTERERGAYARANPIGYRAQTVREAHEILLADPDRDVIVDRPGPAGRLILRIRDAVAVAYWRWLEWRTKRRLRSR